jgi:hypothetical protein
MSSLIQMLMDSSLVTGMYSTQCYENSFNKYSGVAGLYMRRVLKVLCISDDCFYTQ